MAPGRSSAAGQTAAAFVFATCQVGAEDAVKGELARARPLWRFAYSRPGFLTFKLDQPPAPLEIPRAVGVFVRASGLTLGKVLAHAPDEQAAAIAKLIAGKPFDRLHVYPRDAAAVGHRGFEPGQDVPASHLQAALLGLKLPGCRGAGLAESGEVALDCVLVGEGEVWVGIHRADDWASRLVGGVFDERLPPHAISRAYLKMREALAFSGMTIKAGELWAEIGCAPGGASQALLEQGAHVLGIDPAEVDPRLLENEKFRHVKKRGADLRRREFRDVKGLAADLNVAPQYTLDTVEAIVTHEAIDIRRLLLTLKLPQMKLADHVDEYLQRIVGWGYKHVTARQLSHNRQEICVAARRRPPVTGKS